MAEGFPLEEPDRIDLNHPAVRLISESTQAWFLSGFGALSRETATIVAGDLIRLDEQVQTGELVGDDLDWAMGFLYTVEAWRESRQQS